MNHLLATSESCSFPVDYASASALSSFTFQEIIIRAHHDLWLVFRAGSDANSRLLVAIENATDTMGLVLDQVARLEQCVYQQSLEWE